MKKISSIKIIFLILILLLLVLFETTIAPIPLVLLFSTLLFFWDDSRLVLFLIFLSGLLLDLGKGDAIGLTSLFSLTSVFLVYQYQRIFETRGVFFIGAIMFLSSFLYARLEGYNIWYIVYAVIAYFLGAFIVKILGRKNSAKI